jgi:hypothetical protein
MSRALRALTKPLASPIVDLLQATLNRRNPRFYFFGSPGKTVGDSASILSRWIVVMDDLRRRDWLPAAQLEGRINYISAARIPVKPCTFGAPLRGFGA